MRTEAQTILFHSGFNMYEHAQGWSLSDMMEDQDSLIELINSNQVGQDEIEDQTSYKFSDGSVIIEKFNKDHGPTFNHYY